MVQRQFKPTRWAFHTKRSCHQPTVCTRTLILGDLFHANRRTDDDCTGSTVTGSITISSSSSGTGVDVSANFQGFPDLATYGPFLYHIHALPVPANGDCTATLGHLDPQNAGEYYPCIVSAPQNCQVGDLAGKYGAITTSPFTAAYSDLFLSTVAGSSAAPVSIVIHTANSKYNIKIDIVSKLMLIRVLQQHASLARTSN